MIWRRVHRHLERPRCDRGPNRHQVLGRLISLFHLPLWEHDHRANIGFCPHSLGSVWQGPSCGCLEGHRQGVGKLKDVLSLCVLDECSIVVKFVFQ